MTKKYCFVIMGYGVKVDHRTGRELDLDKTYKNIIKPAVEGLGMECIRADEIKHSGTIDVPMYKWLVKADVVIADLSTYNPNAFYELGVRHALRPYTTIAISESKLEPPFDVNHTVIRSYEHLGKGIDYDEVLRFQKELTDLMSEILTNPIVDSPVYTYLSDLQPPQQASKQSEWHEESNPKETLSAIVESAKESIDAGDFIKALEPLKLAREIDPNNVYLLQQLVLATYKGGQPSKVEALNNALEQLGALEPDKSTDTETLGLAGAIYKRLWEETENRGCLTTAIDYYEKGFQIKHDYYNGINLAYLLNVRSVLCEGDDAIADRVLARRVREQVVAICNKLLNDNFDKRGDKYWVWATLEESYFGLGRTAEWETAKKEAVALANIDWQRKSTEEQIGKLNLILKGKG